MHAFLGISLTEQNESSFRVDICLGSHCSYLLLGWRSEWLQKRERKKGEIGGRLFLSASDEPGWIRPGVCSKSSSLPHLAVLPGCPPPPICCTV